MLSLNKDFHFAKGDCLWQIFQKLQKRLRLRVFSSPLPDSLQRVGRGGQPFFASAGFVGKKYLYFSFPNWILFDIFG
jgi:hypothetical protein